MEKMNPGRKKVKDARRRVMLSGYVRIWKKGHKKAKKARVFITLFQRAVIREIARLTVRNILSSLIYLSKIYETRTGSVISSHCGPGNDRSSFYCRKENNFRGMYENKFTKKR